MKTIDQVRTRINRLMEDRDRLSRAIGDRTPTKDERLWISAFDHQITILEWVISE